MWRETHKQFCKLAAESLVMIHAMFVVLSVCCMLHALHARPFLQVNDTPEINVR